MFSIWEALSSEQKNIAIRRCVGLATLLDGLKCPFPVRVETTVEEDVRLLTVFVYRGEDPVFSLEWSTE